MDTICAVATPPGRGGIGIVRISGTTAKEIGESIGGKELTPRLATFCRFRSRGKQLDEGIVLFFPAPQSFTGEDVVELQGHGGPVVQNMILQACLSAGARLANPGEFSQRAFLNDRLDLTQAEAIADLINASTETAAHTAARSLTGLFSEQILIFQEDLTRMRLFVEAAIDFPEEEIDFISESTLLDQLDSCIQRIAEITKKAHHASIIQEGIRVAIIGRPNAGKSSLINRLCGENLAIVTDIAGTTRDAIEKNIDINGIAVTLIDTAGLNDSPDTVEKIGIDLSQQKALNAEIALCVIDSNAVKDHEVESHLGSYKSILQQAKNLILVCNKIDLLSSEPENFSIQRKGISQINISTKQGVGIENLKQAILQKLNLTDKEPEFSARTRHVDVLKKSIAILTKAKDSFIEHESGELLAEDLRLVQQTLSEITGDFSADDLLGDIFSSFCIGK